MAELVQVTFRQNGLLSWELTYPLPAGTFEDDVPFPNAGYAGLLEGRLSWDFFPNCEDFSN